VTAGWRFGLHRPPGKAWDESGGDLHAVDINIGDHIAAVTVCGKTEAEAKSRAGAILFAMAVDGTPPEVPAPRDDGGPAFPFSALSPEGPSVYRDNEGMSLRDYFAAAALQGYLAAYTGADVRMPDPDAAAARAFEYADAMLKARKA
jgi:hypothetical protein